MQSRTTAALRGGARAVSDFFGRWFPQPELLAPRAAGIDISDASVRWIVLAPREKNHRVLSWGTHPLPEGIVVNGIVQNVPALAEALQEVRKRLGRVDCAHAALPEEAAYVFSMHVPEADAREQILSMIEFELDGRVPIPPSAAVYDFNAIARRDEGEGMEIGVIVFPRELAESYVAAFNAADIQLLSLELEARSIARAVSSERTEEPITLLADFGRARTGFAVLKQGVPIFTSTVAVGGEAMTRALMEKLSLSPEEAETFKNEEGLFAEAGPKSPGVEALSGSASALADEITRHYHYWDTRRNEHGERMTPVERVVLVGGSANLKGITDYISGRVQAPTECGNVWRNVCSFDDYIPPIDRRASLQYATAIGLALRGL